jgi:phospholipase/carboxylesterase
MAFPELTWQTYRPEGFYTSEVQTQTFRPMPVRTFLPHGYEPRYPYPLVVFFHGTGGNEEQILRLAPKLSRRNFISIGLRGPVCLGPNLKGQMGYSWNDCDAWPQVEEYLIQAVQQTRRSFHVHSERIYLAGFAEGAEMAYRLGLAMAGKIAGIISLNGCMPRFDRPRLPWHEIRDLRVLIAHGIANAKLPLSMARDDYRLLYSAGASVEFKSYPATQKLHPEMLRDVNRWIVEQCDCPHD